MNRKLSDEEIAWRKKFGDKLKRLIHIRSMTQKQVAFELGLDPSMLSRYIRGVHSPSAYTIEQLAKILKCDINYLYDVNS